MGQFLHRSATTTEAIRRAIQHSQASLRTLAKRYGINQKTVAKWKRRTSVADLSPGVRDALSRERHRASLHETHHRRTTGEIEQSRARDRVLLSGCP